MAKKIVKIARWFERLASQRRVVRELSALTDRELRDIGLSRCDIYDIARKVA